MVPVAEIGPWLAGLGEVAKIGVGGVLAATVTLYFNGRRQNRELDRAARSLATRLIEIFERYAAACAEAHHWQAHKSMEDPYDWSAVGSVPALGELPDDDAGWRAIEPRFAIFARTFGMRIERSIGIVRWEAEMTDAEDTAYEVERQVAKLGHEAISYSAELRSQYSLGDADFGWDLRGHFIGELHRNEVRDAAKAEANRKVWEEVSQSAASTDNAAAVGTSAAAAAEPRGSPGSSG